MSLLIQIWTNKFNSVWVCGQEISNLKIWLWSSGLAASPDFDWMSNSLLSVASLFPVYSKKLNFLFQIFKRVFTLFLTIPANMRNFKQKRGFSLSGKPETILGGTVLIQKTFRDTQIIGQIVKIFFLEAIKKKTWEDLGHRFN